MSFRARSMATRHQLREKGNEQREVEKVASRLQTPPVDIERITQGLERVERYPDRQNHLQGEGGDLPAKQPRQVRQPVGKKPKIEPRRDSWRLIGLSQAAKADPCSC